MKVQSRILDNGLPLVVVEGGSEHLAAVQFHVSVGSAKEGRWAGGGLSHFVEHLLFKGTKRRNWMEINSEAGRLGGDANAYTSFERTVYHLQVANGDLAPALDLLNDQVFHSTFPDEEFEREREVINRERVMGQDDPDWQIFELGMATMFKRHGARFPIIGEDDIFRALSVDDVREFHSTYYRPPQVALVVAGGVKMDEVVRVANVLQVPVALEGEGATAGPEGPVVERRESRRSRDCDLVRGWIGFRGPSAFTREGVALGMALNALAGTRFSQMDVDLVERRAVAHELDVSSIDVGGGEQLYVFSYLADCGKREAVEAAVAEHLGRAAINGFSNREWEGFRCYGQFGRARSKQFANHLADVHGAAWMATGSVESVAECESWHDSMTAEESVEALGRYCRADLGVWVSLGPGEGQA